MSIHLIAATLLLYIVFRAEATPSWEATYRINRVLLPLARLTLVSLAVFLIHTAP